MDGHSFYEVCFCLTQQAAKHYTQPFSHSAHPSGTEKRIRKKEKNKLHGLR